MKKTVYTIILAVVAIAALCWACSFKIDGLAWFPGFMVAVFCGIKILDIWEAKETNKKYTRF